MNPTWNQLHAAFTPTVARVLGVEAEGSRCVTDIDAWNFCEVCGDDLSETQMPGKFLSQTRERLVFVHRLCLKGHPGFYGFKILAGSHDPEHGSAR